MSPYWLKQVIKTKLTATCGRDSLNGETSSSLLTIEYVSVLLQNVAHHPLHGGELPARVPLGFRQSRKFSQEAAEELPRVALQSRGPRRGVGDVGFAVRLRGARQRVVVGVLAVLPLRFWWVAVRGVHPEGAGPLRGVVCPRVAVVGVLRRAHCELSHGRDSILRENNAAHDSGHV